MDFSYLLDLAKQNEEQAREAAQVKRYSTQVSASKKIPRSGVQSQAIQAFLAKKEAEEKKKKLEELRKKETLLSLRAQDRKSNARVQAMLKRTKAANKAVLDEVKGALNSTITSNEQPDEDDYGYVSNEASAFYKKLINKYSVDEPNAHKEKERPRVEPKIVKPIRTEEVKTNGKKHASKELHQSKPEAKGDRVSLKEKEAKKAPPKPPEATLSFDQILKLAAQKQHQPVKLEKKVENFEKKTAEDERPMTKKEREELLRRKQEERERQLRKLARESEASSIAGKLSSAKPAPPNKAKENLTLKASSSKDIHKPNGLPMKPPEKLNSASVSSAAKQGSSKPEAPKTKPVSQVPKGLVQPATAKPAMSRGPVPSSTGRKSPLPPPVAKPSIKGKSLPSSREPSRPFPPYRRDHSMERPVKSYKRSIESDEEYDSELDDFIDDGPDETEDYSKHIQEIFGYDKSRYRRIVSDDEDECMESSFAQQMREERISTRIGIMEDLEEERREREEEERKKKLMAAKRAKTRK